MSTAVQPAYLSHAAGAPQLWDILSEGLRSLRDRIKACFSSCMQKCEDWLEDSPYSSVTDAEYAKRPHLNNVDVNQLVSQEYTYRKF